MKIITIEISNNKTIINWDSKDFLDEAEVAAVMYACYNRIQVQRYHKQDESTPETLDNPQHPQP